MILCNLLRFPEAASLGLHAMAYLAKHPEGYLTAPRVAGALGASTHHLAKVLQRLVKVGLTDSATGPQGGFRLAKPAAEVTLLEICEAIEGPLGEPGCLLGRSVCDGKDCLIGELIQSIGQQLEEFLTKTSLAQLANRAGVLK